MLRLKPQHLSAAQRIPPGSGRDRRCGGLSLMADSHKRSAEDDGAVVEVKRPKMDGSELAVSQAKRPQLKQQVGTWQCCREMAGPVQPGAR